MTKPVLVDTDVMVDFLRGHPKAVALVHAQSARIILSSIVAAELYAGVRGDGELITLLNTLHIKHYPMIKGLKPAYTKTSGGQRSVPGDA